MYRRYSVRNFAGTLNIQFGFFRDSCFLGNCLNILYLKFMPFSLLHTLLPKFMVYYQPITRLYVIVCRFSQFLQATVRIFEISRDRCLPNFLCLPNAISFSYHSALNNHYSVFKQPTFHQAPISISFLGAKERFWWGKSCAESHFGSIIHFM